MSYIEAGIAAVANGGSITALTNGPAFSGDTTGATDVVNLQSELNALSVAAGNSGTAKLWLVAPGVYYVNGPLYQPWNVKVHIDASVEIRAVGAWGATQDLWQDSPPTTIAAGSDGGAIENIAAWASPSAGVLAVASTVGYPQSGQARVKAVYSTTIGADSNGGDITTVASWASPAAGQLAVASTAEAGTSGTVVVATSGGTAQVAYTGVGTDGSGHPVLTGCTLVDGSGTVSTGGSVTKNSTAIVNYTGISGNTLTGCTLANAPVGIVNTGNPVSARTADGYLQGKGTLNANSLARHALYLHYFAGFTIGVRCINSLQDDVVLGDSAAVSSSFGPTLALEFCTDRTTGSTPTGGYRSLWVSASCSDGTFYGSQDAQLKGQQIGIQCDGADWKFNNPHPWSLDNGMTIAFYDNGWNNRWRGLTADGPTQIGLQLGAGQNYGHYEGLVVQNSVSQGLDNVVIGVKNLSSGQANVFVGWKMRGADATHRLKQDYNGDQTNTQFFGCDASLNVVTWGVANRAKVPAGASGSGSALTSWTFEAAASDTVPINAWYTSGLATRLAVVDHSGNIRTKSAGVGFATAEGSNAKQGVATLSGGTVVVANTSVTATSRIFLTAQDGSSTGALRVSARTAGTSFTITSSNAGDSGVVAYEIFEPG